MYQFLQFGQDKKDAWRIYTEEQLKDPSQLPSLPAFETVLMVDQDPEQVLENDLDPYDLVKYFGPFYLDFDTCDEVPELDQVLDNVRIVLEHLQNKLDIPPEFIHCWLSGGKGVHMTIPARVFGVKSPAKILPMIYREVAASFRVPGLDMSVYSCGRGRMWRVEGMARPGTGTFKVATTPSELATMDAEEYRLLVAAPRPIMKINEPATNLSFAKAEQLYKAAKITANKKLRAMREACVVPTETLRKWEGLPGCVEILITEGDCSTSNWNQAAMQLATYIAACYTKEEADEYNELLVKPFCKNVDSSSRSDEMERRKHVAGQLARAFRGSLKFAPGAFIAAIGKPCGHCPICRSDLAKGETSQEEADSNFLHSTRTRWDSEGYWLVAEAGSRQLTSFTYWPQTEVFELLPVVLPNGAPGWKESPRRELIGQLIDDEGVVFNDVTVPERAWGSKRDLINAVKGQGDALVYCGDADVQRLLKTVMSFGRAKAENKELDKMVRTKVCGVVFDRSGKGTVPHYVEAEGSVTTSGRSQYRFTGNARQSPALLSAPNPYVDDVELEDAISALCRVNEPVQMALTIGWFVACHFREHIQYEEPQFPVLNISGNSEAGKTSLAVLVAMLNGIDYTKAEFLNVETGNIYPLTQYISSSTTVPRLVEEVNPAVLGAKYQQVLGYLKGSWNKAPIARGRISERELSVSTEDRVSAPIVYTSEQTAQVPSIRSRSVEVKLSSRTLSQSDYVDNYNRAISKRQALVRIAKALMTVSMNTSPRSLLDIFHSKDSLIAKSVSPRPRWGFKACLTGLHMLIHTMEEYKVGGVEEVQDLYNQLVEYLGGRVVDAERGKAASEVDRVLATLNMLAEEPEGSPTALRAGRHYWRNGDSIYLVVQSCLPLYLRYMKSLGETAVIRDFQQMSSLLQGEVYFDRKESHPTRFGTDVFVISYEKLQDRGTALNNFNDSTEPDDE